jgi:hypothetical protein
MATVVDIFEINVQPIAEQLSALGAQIDTAKKKYNELKVAQGEYDESTIKAKSDVTALTKEYRSIETVIVNNTKALYALDKTAQDSLKTRQFEANSIDTNRKLYNSLYNEMVRQKQPTKDNIELIKKLSNTLKEQESALGDTRRNVGNYAEGFTQAIGGLKAFGVSTDTITKGLETAKMGFQSAGGGVKGFGMALATTGLPLFIMAFQQLINVFEGFKPIADAVENAVRAVGDAFNALISGGSITQAVKEGQELLEVMRDLEDTEKAYAITSEASRKKVNELITQSKDRAKTEKEKLAIIDEANRVEKKAFDESVKRNEELLKKQMEIFSRKNKLSGEELDLLTKGTSKEALELRTRLERSTAFKEKELEAIQEGLLKRVQLEGDSNILQEKLLNRRNALLEKEDEERAKANEKAQARAEKRQAELERELEKERLAKEKYNQDIDKLTDEFILSEREKLEKTYEQKFDLVVGNSAEEVALRTEIEKQKLEALAKFDEEANKKIQAQQKKVADEQKAINAKQFNEQIEQNKRTLDLELEAVDLSVGTEQEKANRKKEIQLKYLEEQLALTREYFGADGVITQAELDGLKKLENAIAKVRQGVAVKDEKATLGSSLGITKQDLGDAQQGLQSIQTAVNAIGSVLSATTEIRLNEIEAQKNAEIQAVEESGLTKIQKEEKIRAIEKKYALEKYEAEKKAFETNKALQIVNAVIAGALGVVSAFQLGPIAGAIAAIAIAATTAAQIAVISSQKAPPPPKFATGVIGLDGAGTGTSDSIDAKLSRGESVMTAKATERFAPILAQMEMSVGNKPNFQLGRKRFATGYIPQGDGGYYARSASASMISNSEMAKSFEMAIQKMPAPTLNYDEFSQFTKSVNSSVNLAEL